MRALSSPELIALAERGSALDARERALLAVATALPTASLETLRATSFGRRDAALLALRRATFGEVLECVATCPACGESLEYELNASLLPGQPPAESSDMEVEAGGRRYRLRAPTADDVQRVLTASGVAVDTAGVAVEDIGAENSVAAARALLRSCVLGPPIDDEAGHLVLEAFERRLAEMEPLTDPQLTLTCPACAFAFQQYFDITSFLWADVQAAVSGLLRDVHALAAAYHWSERDILALPATRRRFYLECVGA